MSNKLQLFHFNSRVFDAAVGQERTEKINLVSQLLYNVLFCLCAFVEFDFGVVMYCSYIVALVLSRL